VELAELALSERLVSVRLVVEAVDTVNSPIRPAL
jgi:hypothetical protein